MNNKWHLGSKAKSITVGAKLDPVTKIVLTGKDNKVFTAGDDTGYVMEIEVPTATQQMANDLLKKAQGFEYQGYKASTAFVPPEIELGDGIETKGIYSILARREYGFTPKIAENISAPYSSEEAHEFKYTGTYKTMLGSKVELGTNYGGFTLDKYEGISISDHFGILSMYQDPTSGRLILTGNADLERALQASHSHGELVESLDRLDQDIHTLQVTDSNLLSEIRDAQGDISRLEQTAYSLSSTIASAQGDISRLEQTASSLSSEIQDVAGNVSRVEQTATSLSSEIKSAQGDISTLRQTATSLTSDIKDAKGNISSLQQTATSLSSNLLDVEGNISTLQQTTTSLSSQISDAKGNISTLQQTTKSLTSQISDAKGNISTLQQTTKSLSSQITDAKGNISTLQQTTTSLSSQISDAKGNISTLQQTTKSLSSDISSAEGSISKLQQTANSLSSDISDAKGNISSLQQTVKSLSSSISDTNSNVSKIEQYAKSITLSVTNGTKSSTIALKAGTTTIASNKIEFTGIVSFSDLEGNGTTKINGANITTGKISAARIDVSELKVNKVYNGISLMLSYNSGTQLGYTLAATKILGSSISISGGTSGAVTLSGGTISLSGAAVVGSYGKKIGFFGSTGATYQAVASNATVATLIAALKKYGLV